LTPQKSNDNDASGSDQTDVRPALVLPAANHHHAAKKKRSALSLSLAKSRQTGFARRKKSAKNNSGGVGGPAGNGASQNQKNFAQTLHTISEQNF
jgi:hypothetical protein